MDSLRTILKNADEQKVAVGHFNAANIEMVWGIFDAARELGVPVIVGFSEGERDFVGVKQSVDLIRSLREEYQYPIFSNADHTYSLERVKEAIDAGFDAVIFDGAKLPIEENIAITKECVEYARSVNPDILVEAEIGYIGSSSKLWDEAPEGASVSEEAFPKPEEAKRFVEETGVDLLAPAVGNLHGMFKHGSNPQLSIPTVKAIREAAGVPMVLHGGSGVTDENFTEAIKAGMALIHISTEIRVAYRKALDASLTESPDELAPYRYMKPSREAAKEVVLGRMKLFNHMT